MRERDFGKRERDIGDGKGTKGDHRTRGINEEEKNRWERSGAGDTTVENQHVQRNGK